jgi:2'-5' RNA ligase
MTPRPMYFTIPLGAHPELIRIQEALRNRYPELDYADPQRFHITVAYVHDAGDHDLRQIKLQRAPSFEAQCVDIRQFDTPDGWAIVLGVEKKGPLPFMQANLYRQLKGRGCEVSEFSVPSDYQPHVTLAYSEKPIDALKLNSPVVVPVRNVCLSEEGYKVVRRWPLRSGPKFAIRSVRAHKAALNAFVKSGNPRYLMAANVKNIKGATTLNNLDGLVSGLMNAATNCRVLGAADLERMLMRDVRVHLLQGTEAEGVKYPSGITGYPLFGSSDEPKSQWNTTLAVLMNLRQEIASLAQEATAGRSEFVAANQVVASVINQAKQQQRAAKSASMKLTIHEMESKIHADIDVLRREIRAVMPKTQSKLSPLAVHLDINSDDQKGIWISFNTPDPATRDALASKVKQIIARHGYHIEKANESYPDFITYVVYGPVRVPLFHGVDDLLGQFGISANSKALPDRPVTGAEYQAHMREMNPGGQAAYQQALDKLKRGKRVRLISRDGKPFYIVPVDYAPSHYIPPGEHGLLGSLTYRLESGGGRVGGMFWHDVEDYLQGVFGIKSARKNRLYDMVFDNNVSMPDVQEEMQKGIQVGDFIKDRHLGTVVGFVVAIGSIAFGKRRIPGYTIRTGSGKKEFVPKENAVRVGYQQLGDPYGKSARAGSRKGEGYDPTRFRARSQQQQIAANELGSLDIEQLYEARQKWEREYSRLFRSNDPKDSAAREHAFIWYQVAKQMYEPKYRAMMNKQLVRLGITANRQPLGKSAKAAPEAGSAREAALSGFRTAMRGRFSRGEGHANTTQDPILNRMVAGGDKLPPMPTLEDVRSEVYQALSKLVATPYGGLPAPITQQQLNNIVGRAASGVGNVVGLYRAFGRPLPAQAPTPDQIAFVGVNTANQINEQVQARHEQSAAQSRERARDTTS